MTSDHLKQPTGSCPERLRKPSRARRRRSRLALAAALVAICNLWQANAAAEQSPQTVTISLDPIAYPPLVLERGYVTFMREETKLSRIDAKNGNHLALVCADRSIQHDDTDKRARFCGSPTPEFYCVGDDILSRLDKSYVNQRRYLHEQGFRVIQQISGTPWHQEHTPDPPLKRTHLFTIDAQYLYHGSANYYPLPVEAEWTRYRDVIVDWAQKAEQRSGAPSIWIGTQEPDHTLGFLDTDGDGVGDPTSEQRENNLKRYIRFWTPIAKALKARGMTVGGIQQNHGGILENRFAKVARELEANGCPLDFFTIQNYSPRLNRAIIRRSRKALSSSYFSMVPVLMNRYDVGFMDKTGSISFKDSEGMCYFLDCESNVIDAPDVYGYCCKLNRMEVPSKMGYEVGRFLVEMPAARRPMTLPTPDLRGFAGGDAEKVHVVIWNRSTGRTHAVNIELNGFHCKKSRPPLSVRLGHGNTITEVTDARIKRNGDSRCTVTGCTLAPKSFLLITVGAAHKIQSEVSTLGFVADQTWCDRTGGSEETPNGAGHYSLREGVLTVATNASSGIGLTGVIYCDVPAASTLRLHSKLDNLPYTGLSKARMQLRFDYMAGRKTLKTYLVTPHGYKPADERFWQRLKWREIADSTSQGVNLDRDGSFAWNIGAMAPRGWKDVPGGERRLSISLLLCDVPGESTPCMAQVRLSHVQEKP